MEVDLHERRAAGERAVRLGGAAAAERAVCNHKMVAGVGAPQVRDGSQREFSALGKGSCWKEGACYQGMVAGVH